MGFHTYIKDGIEYQDVGTEEPREVPIKTCMFCKGKLDGNKVPVFSYWQPFKHYSHPECLKQGEQEEAYKCQKIDADCNDCGYFQRLKKIDKGIFKGKCLNPDGQQLGSRWALGGTFGIPRLTDKKIDLKDDEVAAFPNFATGRPCFVHRQDCN